MTPWLVAQLVEIEAIKAEIEGMKAHNQAAGDGSVYTEEAFLNTAARLRDIANNILARWQEGLI